MSKLGINGFCYILSHPALFLFFFFFLRLRFFGGESESSESSTNLRDSTCVVSKSLHTYNRTSVQWDKYRMVKRNEKNNMDVYGIVLRGVDHKFWGVFIFYFFRQKKYEYARTHTFKGWRAGVVFGGISSGQLAGISTKHCCNGGYFLLWEIR